jgi:hypothetical protein
MPIPDLTPEGFLPEGIHDCTLNEIRERFGQFQESDFRCRLFEKLEEFVRQASRTGLVTAVIVDGSFVTARPEPNDVDIIVVVRPDHDFRAELRPFEYNAVSRPAIRRMFRIDALVGRLGRDELTVHTELFSRIRSRDDVRKGMLRLWL